MACIFAVVHLYNLLFLNLLIPFYIKNKSGIDKLDRMIDNTCMSEPYVLF